MAKLNPTGVSFLLLLFSFFFFYVTDCELGIGFQKELCVVGGCNALDVQLVLATCGWWGKIRES
jgi:hypothetical protein